MQKNTYLQTRLDVYWLLHNFVRPHFTTKAVPAVALGILSVGLSVAGLFRFHYLQHTELNQCRVQAPADYAHEVQRPSCGE